MATNWLIHLGGLRVLGDDWANYAGNSIMRTLECGNPLIDAENGVGRESLHYRADTAEVIWPLAETDLEVEVAHEATPVSRRDDRSFLITFILHLSYLVSLPSHPA